MKKVVLITGGSEGLGLAIAERLVKSNSWEVIILANNAAKLEKAAETLGCAHMVCDISDPKQVEKVTNLIMAEYGRLDVLINNAGVITTGPLENCSYEAISKVIDVNTLGTLYFCKAVIPGMKKQKHGKIINIDSVAGLLCRRERTVYNASKWAVTGFTECLREELAPFGISVMGLYPALMATNLFANAGLENKTKGAMDPADVAKVVEFMLSFENLGFDKVVVRNPIYA